MALATDTLCILVGCETSGPRAALAAYDAAQGLSWAPADLKHRLGEAIPATFNSPPPGPHYTVENCRGWNPRVWLNEKLVSHVVEAHTDEGWVICYKHDADGRLILVGEHLEFEKLSGRVAVTFKEPNE